MNDKWELENYKILKNFMNGDPIVAKEKDSKSKWLKRQGNTIINWENKSISWDFLICKILEGCFKMYEQEPQLVWVTNDRDHWFSGVKNFSIYNIYKCCNGLILTVKTIRLTEFLGFYTDIDSVKEAAQRHSEENN